MQQVEVLVIHLLVTGAGKLRKYYSLTKSGRRFLAEKQEEWRQYSGAVEQVLGKSTLALDGVGKFRMGGVGFAGI